MLASLLVKKINKRIAGIAWAYKKYYLADGRLIYPGDRWINEGLGSPKNHLADLVKWPLSGVKQVTWEDREDGYIWG